MTHSGHVMGDWLSLSTRAAIDTLSTLDDAELVDAVTFISEAVIHGQNVFTMGMGKSAITAQKTAASFRSFGLPAFHIHAADCSHGDIGAVNVGDVIIAYTHSGRTSEVVAALSALDKKLGKNYRLILVTSSRDAVAALQPDAVLPYQAVEFLNHVPTSSCVAQLVYGDALLVGVTERLELTIDDFSINHPGGNLGKQLTT